MMSYEETRMFKAHVTKKYACNGFVDSAKEVAKKILEANTVEDIKTLLDGIMLEYEVVEYAKSDFDYVVKAYGKKEGESDDED